METVFTILFQVIIMFVLAGVGYLMFKYKKISSEGSKSIGNILIYLSLPCVILNSFLVERTPEKIDALKYSIVFGFLALAVSVIVARIMFKKNPIENFAASFSNPGFFGVPLVLAAFNEEAVFYMAPFIAFINLGQWTYGVSLLEGDKSNKTDVKDILKRLIKAPFMVGIIVGLFFFFTGLAMPEIPGKCINFIANLNTPLAMFTIGIYLAQTDMAKMFVKPRLYLVSFARMIVTPLIMMAIISLLPNDMYVLKMTILIVSACPVGSNVAVYAELHDADYPYAVETVVISTLSSIVTIPLLVGLASMIWN
ncbi:MAG: AEC family transporter [Lachnospiraceae bacterium]|nr:AEC family transporter [Lachnospiraceae bacterium]